MCTVIERISAYYGKPFPTKNHEFPHNPGKCCSLPSGIRISAMNVWLPLGSLVKTDE